MLKPCWRIFHTLLNLSRIWLLTNNQHIIESTTLYFADTILLELSYLPRKCGIQSDKHLVLLLDSKNRHCFYNSGQYPISDFWTWLAFDYIVLLWTLTWNQLCSDHYPCIRDTYQFIFRFSLYPFNTKLTFETFPKFGMRSATPDEMWKIINCNPTCSDFSEKQSQTYLHSAKNYCLTVLQIIGLLPDSYLSGHVIKHFEQANNLI